AYAAGPPGDTAKIGCSDDGEPQGTAGRPMLNVLLHGGVGECVAVVTRYFGGVKLGAGGLVRAYSGVTAAAMQSLPIREKIIPVRVRIRIPYNHLTLLKRLFVRVEAQTEAEEFSELAEFIISLPREHLDELQKEVSSMSAGKALVEMLDG
ncbi:MAG: YigZ family protein, partial [Desulfovibrionaceae bacterium]|nr:YigZ family protein [Desulfovibrionaceae bacterium]